MRPQIVLFGDSITQQSFRSGGWGAALADIYSRKVDVVLRGYGGYNTRWALLMLNQIFPLEPELYFQVCSCQHQTGSAKPPVAVTIFFGANDAARLEGTGKRQHVPVEEYKDNLRKIVQHIKSGSPNTLVILITPPPIDVEGRREYARSLYGDKASETPDRTNEATGVYAKQCVTLANELGLPSVDVWSKMQETEGWQKKFLSDGLHLTPEGNAVVFSEVVKIFDEAGFSDLPYDFPPNSEIDAEHPEKAFLQHCPAV
ncbi:GDSL esterase/lipase At5g62930 isoform X2 [Sesamum indicum]|uniref:GDSL esterase/lipase At5g62930 isoform X2 n=1 Tax=Sesamum indicum TaxID=4182 RepID=A0A6I9SWF9_SESIN|nr:GDSL esterase/lipase At5g62930 isoform X2 [Sesamum indicum]